MNIYPGEVDNIAEKISHGDVLTHIEYWTVCDVIWSGSHTVYRYADEYSQQVRRMQVIEKALGGCAEAGRLMAIDAIDETIEVNLRWNSCQGASAEITVHAEDGPLVTRPEVHETGSGPTLGAALLAALMKARFKLYEAENDLEAARRAVVKEARQCGESPPAMERAPTSDSRKAHERAALSISIAR